MKKVLNILLLIILFVVLFINSVILISSWINPDEVPSFFGWKPFITLSGSMETEIFAGDLAVVKEVDTSELKVGDVIAFRQGDIVITHRIQEIINQNGRISYITKGDNNNVQDVSPVYEDMIEGKYMFKIAKLGNVAMFMQTPLGMIVIIAIPVLLLLVIQTGKNKKKTVDEKKMQEEIERLKEENKKLSKKA